MNKDSFFKKMYVNFLLCTRQCAVVLGSMDNVIPVLEMLTVGWRRHTERNNYGSVNTTIVANLYFLLHSFRRSGNTEEVKFLIDS